MASVYTLSASHQHYYRDYRGMTTAAPSTYRPPTQSRPNTTDDYERWYTEATPNNRMLLALRSGIGTEIAWALDRLCRLCNNEQFVLRAIPGLTDALFEWPEWYVREGAEECARVSQFFSLSPDLERKKRHAMESLFILRNAAINEPNSEELAAHPRTRALVLLTLHKLKAETDANTEFILYIIDLLQSVAVALILPPPDSSPLASPVPPLREIAGSSSDRSLIMAALSCLTVILSNPSNMVHLTADSPALEAATRVLPLFIDKEIVDVALNYLYTHLSSLPMSKAFLLHPRMQGTLKLLVSFILSEQIEETVSLSVGEPARTVPADTVATKVHELTQEELDSLVAMPEPQRCYEWMKTMFVTKIDGELTQVDFWNLYKDCFLTYQDRYPLLVASDVIKNVNLVFPQAQAMVLPGPPQKFIVRGVDRRKDEILDGDYRCLWDSWQCMAPPFKSTGELYEHILHEHIDVHEGTEITCSWASCSRPPLPKSQMRGHVLTHLPSMQRTPRHPTQSDLVTLPEEDATYPISDPTSRPPPPLRSAILSYRRPVADPSSSALTALLCIRILFRTSFASSDAAPRADEDHFGFPGVLEEEDENDIAMDRNGRTDLEKEGERRGRKAFLSIRHLLEGVRIRDDVLMEWITEMIESGTSP